MTKQNFQVAVSGADLVAKINALPHVDRILVRTNPNPGGFRVIEMNVTAGGLLQVVYDDEPVT